MRDAIDGCDIFSHRASEFLEGAFVGVAEQCDLDNSPDQGDFRNDGAFGFNWKAVYAINARFDFVQRNRIVSADNQLSEYAAHTFGCGALDFIYALQAFDGFLNSNANSFFYFFGCSSQIRDADAHCAHINIWKLFLIHQH